jgi:hypothetical protein
MLVLEDQVTAGQVCLALKLVVCPAEEPFLVIELEGGLGSWPAGPDGNVPASATVTGTGIVEIQGCIPNCAQGTETPEPVTVVLSDPVAGPHDLGHMTEVVSGQNMAEMGGEVTDGVYTYPNAWALGAS